MFEDMGNAPLSAADTSEHGDVIVVMFKLYDVSQQVVSFTE